MFKNVCNLTDLRKQKKGLEWPRKFQGKVVTIQYFSILDYQNPDDTFLFPSNL